MHKLVLFAPEHRRQIRLLQAVCVLAPRAGIEAGDEACKTMLRLLTGDAHYVTRMLCALGIARLCLAQPSRSFKLLEYLRDTKQKAAPLYGAVSAAGAFLVNFKGPTAESVTTTMLPILLPHISGPLAVRNTTQATFAMLLALGRIPPALVAMADGISRLMAAQDDFEKVLLTCWPGVNIGKLLQCSILDVLNGMPLLLEGFPRLDVAGTTLCMYLDARFGTRRQDDGVVLDTPMCLVPAEYASIAADRSRRAEVDAWGSGAGTAVVDEVQRKPTPWAFGEEEEISRHSRRSKQDLILVASLVEKEPNLGGMCRSADIFNLREMVVQDLGVCQTQQFTTASVTAERWVPMREVKESQLPQYLEEKRREGYTLFGVEQTSDSIALNHVSFPKRSLLLLGKERTGIPANIISLLDRCIEVPQLGVIRSLNVHVTASLVIWEFSKQHAFSSC
jgi:tRNA G18 (ribose-2'-O)-methylase SpoU